MPDNSTPQVGQSAAVSQNQAVNANLTPSALVEPQQAQPAQLEKPQQPELEKPQQPQSARQAEQPQPEKPATDSKRKEDLAAREEAKPNADVKEAAKERAGAAAAKVDTKQTSKDTVEQRKKILEAEKIFQEGIASIRDLIAPSSFEVGYDHLKIDGMYCQTFFVYTYPRYIDTNWLSPVVNYDVTMDISQFIYPISSESIMKTLKTKVAQLQSSIRMSAEKGNVRDPALETALEDAETLRTELQRGQEKFFQFGLYFTLYSEKEDELKRASKELQSLLAGKLVLTKRADLQMERGFNSTIPICMDEIDTDRNMNTSPLSTTFPFISAELTSNDGILYGLNRHNEGLIIFDRFSLENANSVVFAKSGAGKSYAVKLEILRSLMFGTDVIVIDPENEYRPLCETVGGTYLNVSLNSDRRINPFDLPTPLEGEELKPGDLLRSSVINLTGLMKLMLGEISPQEEGILDKALIDTYATKGITMEVVDTSPFQVPTMKDFHNVLSSMEGAADMAQRMAKFVSGTYAGVFNQETNVTLDTGLMVFSVRDLEDELRPIAMYIILNYIWNRVRSSLRKRILVIDEAWSLMQHDDSAKFLFGLVKRARKYYLGITTITQDVEDFVHSPFGKPIITNSSMQLLLKQAPSAVESLKTIFNLTEGEKYLLLNSGVGQGLFFAGLKHVAIQVIASFSEDKIVTTNPAEILAQGAAAAEYEEAVEGAETAGEGMEEVAKEGASEGADAEEVAKEGAIANGLEDSGPVRMGEGGEIGGANASVVENVVASENGQNNRLKVTAGGELEDKYEVAQEGAGEEEADMEEAPDVAAEAQPQMQSQMQPEVQPQMQSQVAQVQPQMRVQNPANVLDTPFEHAEPEAPVASVEPAVQQSAPMQPQPGPIQEVPVEFEG